MSLIRKRQSQPLRDHTELSMRSLLGCFDRTQRKEWLERQLLLSERSNSQFKEPFFDVGADHIGVVFLKIVKTRAKLHESAVLQFFDDALSHSWRYNRAWVSRE